MDDLPNDYLVINDITRTRGNIDHVVIGPTGIFIIDTKNWRGTVSAGNDGALILNGKETDKPEIHNLERMVDDFHDKIKSLCGRDYRVRGVMAFVSTRVEARFGTTKRIHCLTEDRLKDYIRNEKYSDHLSPDDRKRIGTAIRKLAEMDAGFAK